jgi:hypothetical protein
LNFKLKKRVDFCQTLVPKYFLFSPSGSRPAA